MMSDPRNSETLARQWIAIQRAGNRISLELQKEVKKIFVDVRRELRSGASVFEINKAVNKIIATEKPIIYKKLGKNLKALSQLVADNAQKQVVAVGGKGDAPKITPTLVNKWITSTPMATTNLSSKDMFDTTFDSATRQAKGSLAMSTAQKDSAGALRERFRAIEAQIMRRMQMIGTTAVNQVSNSAKQLTFNAAGEVADRVMWYSTLDARTSPFCMQADGKVFPIKSGPRPPAHPSCRSTIVLIGKGESAKQVQRDLMPRPAVEPRSKGFKSEDLRKSKGKNKGQIKKPRKDGDLKGTTVRNTTYETWLKSQPAEYQNSILGKNAGARLRSGETLGAVLKDTRSSINFDSLSEALSA